MTANHWDRRAPSPKETVCSRELKTAWNVKGYSKPRATIHSVPTRVLRSAAVTLLMFTLFPWGCLVRSTIHSICCSTHCGVFANSSMEFIMMWNWREAEIKSGWCWHDCRPNLGIDIHLSYITSSRQRSAAPAHSSPSKTWLGHEPVIWGPHLSP